MRDALTMAEVRFTERAQSLLGGGQAGFWVDDLETLRKARQVMDVAQEAWVQQVRSNPQSVKVTSVFGDNKLLVWCTCIIVFLVHVVLISELFFGW